VAITELQLLPSLVRARSGRVRLAEDSDLEEILSVQERSSKSGLAHIHGLAHPLQTEAIRSRWRSAYSSPRNTFIVHERQGQLTGVCMISGPWIHAMQVVPEAWGTGVGATLHEDALIRLRATGEREGLLRCLAENERAHRFWRKHGWEPIPGGVSPHQDPPHAEVWVWWRPLYDAQSAITDAAQRA
jgi:N-acetylglutamate synthase-like GNAT family acetyltransferase